MLSADKITVGLSVHLPPFRRSAVPLTRRTPYLSSTHSRGRLASTGMKKKLQRAQVQSPGKTIWNVSTANTELALAA
jgi:hypothetical protein